MSTVSTVPSEELIGMAPVPVGIEELAHRRVAPMQALAAAAASIVATSQAMAQRFHHGGKLIAFGNGGSATDAQHLAVEFVHPVVVGKRALPAISLTADVASLTAVADRDGPTEVFAHQLRVLAEPADIAVGIGADSVSSSMWRGLEVAAELGLLRVGLLGVSGSTATTRARPGVVDHLLVAGSDDPQVVKEVQVTTYHLLWELVHVFLDRPDLLDLAGPVWP
jgi:D-sedoheptulose 7-phosphate isomerase